MAASNGPNGGGRARRPAGAAETGPRKVRAWSPSRPDPRGAPPLAIGQVLISAEQFARRESGAFMTQDEWRAIVGDRIARNTRLGRLRSGVLTVKVSSSAWCSELSFLKADLLQRIARAGRDVTDLTFRVDRDAPSASSTPRPFAKKRPEPTSPVAVELPAELRARLAQIEDPNLRAAITEAARWSFREKKS